MDGRPPSGGVSRHGLLRGLALACLAVVLTSLALAPMAFAGHGGGSTNAAGANPNAGGANANGPAAGSQAGGNGNGGNGAGHGNSGTTAAPSTATAPSTSSAAGSQGKGKGLTKGVGHSASSGTATPTSTSGTTATSPGNSRHGANNPGNGNGNGGVGNGNGKGNISKAGTGGTPTPPAVTPTPTPVAPTTPTATSKPRHTTRRASATGSRGRRTSSTPVGAVSPVTATGFGAPTLLGGTTGTTPPAAHGKRPTRTAAPTRGTGSGGASGTGHAPATLAHDINGIVRVVPLWVWVLLGVLGACFFLSATVAAAFARRARYADALVGRIRTAAITDPLTGLFNRRGFAEALSVEIARARRFDHPLAVAFLDVRGLKAVNDDFGHQAGDDLLKAVAQLLRRTSRQADIVARVGGDEMAVALIEQDRAGAVAFARRIAAEVPHARAELGVLADWDLTVGVAVFPEDGEVGEELLAAADRRLYMRRGIALHSSRR